MTLEIALTSKQIQFDRAVKKKPVVLFGGAKGGGKSHGLRLLMLKRRIEYPGSIGYLFRKTYPELEANHISPLFEQFPGLKEYYNEGKKTLRLPNGSQLRFAYVEYARDLPKFQGREMHDLGIEEAGDWPFDHYEYLWAQNRSSKPGIPARCLLTGNPGGIGHKWLKRLFIEKRYEGAENASDYEFIPARVDDNPALIKADPRYAARLEAMKNENLRKAFRYGDWDISAGQFFSELNRDIHLVEPLDIPDHWNRFWSHDPGFNHPAVWLWWAVDEDGTAYLYREWAKAQVHLDEQAEMLKSFSDFKKIRVAHAGRDAWAKRFVASKHEISPPTIAEVLQKHGVSLIPATTERVQGANQVRMFLRYEEKVDEKGNPYRVGPRVRIFNTCPMTYECLVRMTHDPNNVEDVLKVDSNSGDPWEGDDCYDAFRYGLMSRPAPSIAPKVETKDRFRKKVTSETSWITA